MIFNRLKLDSPYRAMAISMGLLFGLGLLLYVIARYLPEPQWALNAIERLSPHVGGLVNAKRVANHLGNSPFLTQVIILYGAFGSFIWMAWFSYLIWRDRVFWIDSIHRNHRQRNLINTFLSKFKYAILMAIVIFISTFLSGYVVFWFEFQGSLGWRDFAFLSNSIFSIIFLITNIVAVSYFVPMCIITLIAIIQFPLNKDIQND